MINKTPNKEISYGSAIREAFVYLLTNYPEVFVIGQGLWSPWYVGNSMTDLDKIFGKDRIIDTPVSENASTGAGIGAALVGMKPIIVHPRMDFMLYAIDPIVNQAAKWSSMTGGQANPSVTIRGIINRGGEQGAQHSQALHSWFCHIPGLKVVMPYSVSDARDLLISAVLSKDPVLFIDDRWLYDEIDIIQDVTELDLNSISPKYLTNGDDLTIVSSGYSTKLALEASYLVDNDLSIEIIDLRILNPFNCEKLIKSVKKTGRLLAIDGGWQTCGLASEIIASTLESIPTDIMKSPPQRLTLTNAPAPCARNLEKIYYPSVEDVIEKINLVTK